MWAAFGLPLLTLGSLVSGAHMHPRSSTSSSSLYAYGDNIGGFPMYYADGNAVVGNTTPENATKVGQVSFDGSSGGSLVGNPADGNSTHKPFSDEELFVPSADSGSTQMGFTSSANSSQVTSKFIWYGHFLLVESESGEYTSLFYAKKGSQSGVYSLQWNITDEDDQEEFISVSMRSVAPSNA